jgi:hypothetical protein
MEEGRREGGLTAFMRHVNQGVNVLVMLVVSFSAVIASSGSNKELREAFARFFNSSNDRMATPNQSTNVHTA